MSLALEMCLYSTWGISGGKVSAVLGNTYLEFLVQ